MDENTKPEFSVTRMGGRTAAAVFEGSSLGTYKWLKAFGGTEDLAGSYEVYCSKTDEYLTVPQFIAQHVTNSVGTIVPKFYSMDPDTEDMFPDSSYLANGMVVLLADNNMRASQKEMANDWGWERALERNRWCTITGLRWAELNNSYQFIALYSDGSKRLRRCSPNEAWIVKIASLAKSEIENSKKYQLIQETITDAMAEAIHIMQTTKNQGFQERKLGDEAMKAINKMVGLLA